MKHRRSAAALFGALLLVLLTVDQAIGLNEGTHELVNRLATQASSLDQVLRQLGFADGIREGLNGSTALRWIEVGGKLEDSPLCRPARHFHDPLKPWTEAGLSTINPLITLPCGGSSFPSSVAWMQTARQDPAGNLGGNWSWHDARRYYQEALATNEPGLWAKTFQALGQIMHLVVDASVPEHVRNDPHLLESFLRALGLRGYGSYEYWVSDQHGMAGSGDERIFIGRYLSSPIGFDPAMLKQRTEADAVAAVPIARLIDTGTYRGAATGPNVTLGPAIGIAEFANANFLTEDTWNDSGYPFPSADGLTPASYVIPSGGHLRGYYRKAAGDGLPVNPVLAECAFEQAALDSGVPWESTVKCTDAVVWAEVAQNMLPRAVGYARGVLDYFFRGRLAATLDVSKDAAGLHATVRITNQATDEDLDGTVSLYYGLRDGTRKWLGTWPLVLATNAQSEPITISPLPPDTPPTAWTLVFEGRLGLEQNAVAVTRVGRHYLGSLEYRAINGFESDSAFQDWSSFLPADMLFVSALDRVGHNATIDPLSGVVSDMPFTEKRDLILYRDPTSPADTMELSTPYAVCVTQESVWYGNYSYRPLAADNYRRNNWFEIGSQADLSRRLFFGGSAEFDNGDDIEGTRVQTELGYRF